ncbi:MAG: carboxymuconolactone decarboxylase family protein [Deltaproteobacteria bacterium]|nr:carboxymuconolactone decarboxylase family protein [Deltaproteobacteria bacterium]
MASLDTIAADRGPLAVASLRLAPLRWSWNPLVWLAALAYRFGAGGAVTPVWVIFARAPGLVLAHLLVVTTSEYLVGLDRRLRALVRVYGSRLNRCSFCDDLEAALALRHRALTAADLDALASFRDSERFSAKERAALAYVEELNAMRTASDATFAALRAHFSEADIVRLTWLNAVGSYLNLQARPLGLSSEGRCALAPR